MEYSLSNAWSDDRIAVMEEGSDGCNGKVPFETALCEKTLASGVDPPRLIDCRRELNALALGEGDGGRGEPFLPLMIADLLGCNVSGVFDNGEPVDTDCCLRFGVKVRKKDHSDSNCTDSNSAVSDAASRRADCMSGCILFSVPRRIKAATIAI